MLIINRNLWGNASRLCKLSPSKFHPLVSPSMVDLITTTPVFQFYVLIHGYFIQQLITHIYHSVFDGQNRPRFSSGSRFRYVPTNVQPFLLFGSGCPRLTLPYSPHPRLKSGHFSREPWFLWRSGKNNFEVQLQFIIAIFLIIILCFIF